MFLVCGEALTICSLVRGKVPICRLASLPAVRPSTSPLVWRVCACRAPFSAASPAIALAHCSLIPLPPRGVDKRFHRYQQAFDRLSSNLIKSNDIFFSDMAPQLSAMLERIDTAGYDFIKIENLYNFDGKASYSAGQGE